MRNRRLNKIGKVTVLNFIASAMIILAVGLIVFFLAKNSLFINFIKKTDIPKRNIC